jgi:RNA-directed DNA polymerase
MDLFERLCSLENLHKAYMEARRNKRYRKSILRFGINLEENLLKLREELLGQTYKHGGYRQFFVYDSKKRLIKVAPFRDRVMHHALCNIIEPIFDQNFIHDSYACRIGKGTHRAIKKLYAFFKILKLSKGNINFYCLKCDIKKYFYNINKDILSRFIKRRVKDKRIIWLVDEIIYSDISSENVGVPIGNLTSQLFANIYLDNLDKFIKHHLRAKYYLRYMDDFLILGHDKRLFHLSIIRIERFLAKYLQLELNHKRTGIFPTRLGVDFLGFINFYYYRLIRKSSVNRFCQKIKYLQRNKISFYDINKKCQSWLSHSRFSSSWYLRRSLEKKLSINFNELF